MRVLGLSACVLALSVLTACSSNTADGMRDDYKSFTHWAKSRPSSLENYLGLVPTGYAGQNRRIALTPPKGAPAVVWNEDNAYGDGAMLTDYNYTDAEPLPPLASDEYGQMVHELFFEHGSVAINAAGKETLKDFAQELKSSGADEDVVVTVVGHASTRVDGVSDPKKRHEINYLMGQKRATWVTKELGKMGVHPGSVQAVSKGEDEPNPNPGDKPQEAADRRVEVYMGDK